jgi:hypothetical protein
MTIKTDYFHFDGFSGMIDEKNQEEVMVSFKKVFEENIDCDFTKDGFKTNKEDITNIINQIEPYKWTYTEYGDWSICQESGSGDYNQELEHDITEYANDFVRFLIDLEKELKDGEEVLVEYD